jgi:transposase-like protein
MGKQDSEKSLMVRCPNCRQMREPDFNETTQRYVCPVCSELLDTQVVVEKKKRGLK